MAVALVAAGCGSDSSSDDKDATPEAAGKPPPAAAEVRAPKERKAERRGTTIKLAGSQYGRVLFDRAGQAIYLFDKETSSRSQCYGDCAAAWPPVLTKGEPQAGTGIAQ